MESNITVKRKPNRQVRMYPIRVTGLNYDQVVDGSRRFVMASDDRKEGYEIGDLLIIQKYSDNQKVGDPVSRTITSIQKSGKGLLRGFIILGIEESNERTT